MFGDHNARVIAEHDADLFDGDDRPERPVHRCAACGRFLKRGEGCPTHDPNWGREVSTTKGGGSE